MDKRGLCGACAHNTGCALPAKLPVWQCEEHTDHAPKQVPSKRTKKDRSRR